MTPNKLASNVNKGSKRRNVKKIPASADQFDVDNQGDVFGFVQRNQGESFRVVDEAGDHFLGAIHIYDGKTDVTDLVIGSPGKPGHSCKIEPGAPNGCYQVRAIPQPHKKPHKINPEDTDNGTLRVGSTPPPGGDDGDGPGRKDDSAHDTERVSPTRRR